jgi:hypothetical protein
VARRERIGQEVLGRGLARKRLRCIAVDAPEPARLLERDLMQAAIGERRGSERARAG